MTTHRTPHFAVSLALAGLVTAGAVLAHDDDPKLLHRRAPVPGSGFAAGLPAGATLPGGGVNDLARGGNFPRANLRLEAWLTLGDLGGSTTGNDIWGYVSPAGREYALMGVRDGLVVVEVTVPGVPVIVETIAGPASLWRDIRTHQDRAYVVSEGGAGIQVVDLSGVDAGVVTLERTVTTGGSSATHNVVVDTGSGYLYRCGGGGQGLRIYDLASPGDPQYVTTWSDRYVHDAQVVTYTAGPHAGRQVAFCCAGLNSGWVDPTLTVLDVTDKQNIVVLSQVAYPGRIYSHQGILSEDRQLFYLGDELDETGSNFTTTHVFDVADLANVTYESSFDNGSRAVGHNMFTARGLLYQANYNDGLRVYDAATDPHHPVEVAYFDTAPASSSATYNGMWGVYPYLPSGTLLCSDLESGLFVLAPDTTLGQAYCAATANSTGLVARVEATGSDVLADNDLDLLATQLPAGVSGYFLASSLQGFTSNPGGSSGNLCLAGDIGRYVGQQGSSGAAGQLQLSVDVAALPQPAGAVTAQVGETWNFQCWFRDSVIGLPTSNFSQGLSITFR